MADGGCLSIFVAILEVYIFFRREVNDLEIGEKWYEIFSSLIDYVISAVHLQVYSSSLVDLDRDFFASCWFPLFPVAYIVDDVFGACMGFGFSFLNSLIVIKSQTPNHFY
jgi:hypothetical protein